MIYVESKYPVAIVIIGLLLICSIRFNSPPASVQGWERRARWATIDGLRGFLALGVYLHHAAFVFTYLKTGYWKIDSSFYFLCGEAGVAFFFLITAFLFYGKILDKKGAVGWRSLYIGRVFRIAPLYLTVIAVLFLVVIFRSAGMQYEEWPVIIKAILIWLGLGALGEPDINGQSAHLITAGVTWTLRYEWLFYLSLPFFAMAARYLGSLILPVLLLVASTILGEGHHSILLAGYFGGGMLVAVAVRRFADFEGDKLQISILTSLLIFALFGFFSDINGISQTLLVTLIFFLICTGNSLFGVLNALGARRLGQISYGIYLWHGVLLTIVMSIPEIRRFSLLSEPNYWIAIGCCSVVLVGLSSITYRWVEKPGIALGRALAAAGSVRGVSSQVN